MVGYTDYAAKGYLDHTTGKTTVFAKTTPVFLALFTVAGTDAGAGFTEISGGGYARASMAAADWSAAAGSSPSSVSNANQITFAQSTAAWNAGAPIIAAGLYDALTGGNLLIWDYLGLGAWKPFVGSLASPSIITCPAHGFAAADQIVMSTEGGGTLMAGGTFTGLLTVAAAPATDTFNVSVNATSTGSGLLRKIVPLVVGSANITPGFAPGQIVLTSG
jgi:hypothetical protein